MSKGQKRFKKTSNRKGVSNNNHYAYGGEYYEVNTGGGKYEVYPTILDGIIERLKIHNRAFVIRFDLHQKDHRTETSEMVTKFIDRLRKRLRTLYSDLGAIHYVWTREHEKAKAQHYHVALMLNYDKVNNAFKIGKLIRKIWESIREGNTVHLVSSETHEVIDRQSFADAVYHLSYLAKVRGKGYRPPQAKDYGASQIKHPSKSK